MDHQTPVAAFIERWRGVTGSEVALKRTRHCEIREPEQSQ